MTVRLDLRMPDDLHAQLKEQAASEMRSAHSLALLFIREALNDGALMEGERSSDRDTHSVTSPRESEAIEETAPTGHSPSMSASELVRSLGDSDTGGLVPVAGKRDPDTCTVTSTPYLGTCSRCGKTGREHLQAKQKVN